MQLKQEHNSLPAVEQTPKSRSKSSDKLSGGAMWQCISSVGDSLKAGDVFRIGRFKVTVLQVVLSGPPRVPKLSALADSEDPVPVSAFTWISGTDVQRDDDDVRRCRICLGDASETDGEEGPIVQAPCLCKGSNGYVHISCLGNWLNTRYGLSDRANERSGEAKGQFLSFKPPCCDVCRTEFPVMVTVGTGPDAKEASLLPGGLPHVAPPFIVLSIPRSRGEDKSRPFGERLIFSPSQSDATLKLGRSAECQLRVDDVSVSRVHATVQHAQGAFILKDNGAKFQTTIRPTGHQSLIDRGEPLAVQSGRTVLAMAYFDPSDEEKKTVPVRASQNPQEEQFRPHVVRNSTATVTSNSNGSRQGNSGQCITM
jgi:pSer/pThr/pTyr-binding forkhead associated (FHA) protein